MIPKIIHYCWFGKGKLPVLAEKCIKSWKKHLPDYEIMIWNEDNFDVNLYNYTREAYDERKFAFVTDVCRLYALNNHGGVYMDTDVEILKPLSEELLNNTAFSGFEDNLNVPTGLMASVKEGRWVKDLLKLYDNRSFYKEDGTFDTTTNVETITNFMTNEMGMLMNNRLQSIDGYCTMYPSEYFCPKSWKTLDIKITDNTYCIHHFAGSWWEKPKFSITYKTVMFFIGERRTKKIFNLYKKFK